MLADLLGKHPEVSIISSAISSLLAFIHVLSPVLSFVALLFAVVISYITLRIKLIEWRKKKDEKTKFK